MGTTDEETNPMLAHHVGKYRICTNGTPNGMSIPVVSSIKKYSVSGTPLTRSDIGQTNSEFTASTH